MTPSPCKLWDLCSCMCAKWEPCTQGNRSEEGGLPHPLAGCHAPRPLGRDAACAWSRRLFWPDWVMHAKSSALQVTR